MYFSRKTRLINRLIESVEQAFLTGTLQNFARRMKLAIDTVQFNFVVIETPWEKLTQRPQVTCRLSTKASSMTRKCGIIFEESINRNTVGNSYGELRELGIVWHLRRFAPAADRSLGAMEPWNIFPENGKSTASQCVVGLSRWVPVGIEAQTVRYVSKISLVRMLMLATSFFTCTRLGNASLNLSIIIWHSRAGWRLHPWAIPGGCAMGLRTGFSQ